MADIYIPCWSEGHQRIGTHHCKEIFCFCQSLSLVQLCDPIGRWTPASLSFTLSRCLLKLMSVELVMPSNHLVLCLLFSSCLLSFSASGSFPVSRLFSSGGQSIGASASASVFSMNIQDWLPLEWIDWFDLLQSRGPGSTYFFLFSFWPHHRDYGILVPWPGIKHRSLAVKVQSPNHWTSREFQKCVFLICYI